jgi:subtilase family serine protease
MKLFCKLLSLSAAAVLAASSAAGAAPLQTRLLPRSAAVDVGALGASAPLSVTVHLKRPNEALFERTVDALYDRTSPTFHHWLSDAQLAQFGPSPAQLAIVRAELERNGLSIRSIAGDRSSIRATGTVAAISRTFHTAIHQYRLNGTVFRANTAPATLSGAAGAYVAHVSGLESHPVKNMLARANNPATKLPLASVPLSKVLAAGGLSSMITDEIVGPKKTFTYTTGGALPTATYTGLPYDPANATLVADYTPKQLQSAMGMNSAYKLGLNGAGQTIVLLEGYGYPNALADANAFASMTGLPKLDASNFSVVYPEGVPSPQAGYLTGWSTEISLDIDWAHAIAPGAKILVVATYGQDSQDFEASMQYIIDNHLGYAVSDSWEEDTDLLAGAAEQEGFEDVLVEAAAKGISFQFSTGDSGDLGLGTPIGAAGVPSVAPHATAVGGTAIQNVPGTNDFRTLGWGDVFSVTVIGNAPIVPGFAEFFAGGGGGGSSIFWPKPGWQASLPGFYRQTPDVSALADPYTGVPIVTSFSATETNQVLVGVGGTSLASPIFTAMWAIANQRAGHSLGQAAPTIASLNKGLIDVLPTVAPFAGAYTDSTGKTTKYTANDLFASLVAAFGFSNQNAFATIYDQPSFQQSAAVAFGLDTSFAVTPGWDNATGYGTPHGLDFINAAAGY